MYVKYLFGQVFGNLTVLQYKERINNETWYLCECICGNRKMIRHSALTSGGTKSCGCKKIVKNEYFYIDANTMGGYTTNTNKIFYFDSEDFDKIKDLPWYENSYGYITSNKNKKNISLSRFLMNYNGKLQIDHIDVDKLNNKKSNLRIATPDIQSKNKKKSQKKKYSSIYKGVCLTKTGKWRASIKSNYKYIHIGMFDTEEEAALAYNKVALKLGFDNINIILEKGEKNE